MSQLHVDAIHSEDGGSSNIVLDDSRNTTCKGNLTVDGDISVTGTGLTDTKSFRNLIINGNHIVSQRRISKTGVTGEYLTDRWAAWGDSMTFDRVDISSASTGPWPEGHRYSMRIKNEAAGSDASATGQYITYKIEAQDMAGSGWNYTQPSSKIALSFWVKTSVAGTYYGSFWTSDGTAKAYNFSLGALSANTWTKVTKIIPGHADLQFDTDTLVKASDTGIRLNLYTHRGTGTTASDAVMDSWHNIDYNKTAPDVTHAFNTTVNATYEFTGVQLEVGDAATSYEHRGYNYELARCQRYCQVWGDLVGLVMRVHSSTQALTHVPLKSPMRADSPTYTIGNAYENFDLLYSGSKIADQNDSGWAFSAGGPRRSGFELMMTRGGGTFSSLDTVMHANIQFEYPDDNLPHIHHYFASATAEL